MTTKTTRTTAARTTTLAGALLAFAGGGVGLYAQQTTQGVEQAEVVEAEPAGQGGDAPGVETAPVYGAWPLCGVPQVPPVRPAPVGGIDLAICLDTSGSMEGLIEAAKQKLWAIVNDLALAEPMPRLRVALLTYGNNGHRPETGWVRVDAGLTEDLDRISEQLFALTTNGGEEYVGRVVNTATTDLAWTTTPGAMKLIVVAGNESADQDPVVRYTAACSAAIGRDIMVNAIYCGNPADELAPGWRDVALRADGHFASIDKDAGTITIVTPFDEELTALSASVNGTYVPFGEYGRRGWANQRAQDLNALGLNNEAAASRATMKARKLYVCDWDLVTACAEGTATLADLPADELPEVMREMTIEQKQAYLDDNSRKRAEIQQQIETVAKQRQDFITAELAKPQNDESKAFDFVLRQAIRDQATTAGFRFPAPRPETAPEPTDPPRSRSRSRKRAPFRFRARSRPRSRSRSRSPSPERERVAGLGSGSGGGSGAGSGRGSGRGRVFGSGSGSGSGRRRGAVAGRWTVSATFRLLTPALSSTRPHARPAPPSSSSRTTPPSGAVSSTACASPDTTCWRPVMATTPTGSCSPPTSTSSSSTSSSPASTASTSCRRSAARGRRCPSSWSPRAEPRRTACAGLRDRRGRLRREALQLDRAPGAGRGGAAALRPSARLDVLRAAASTAAPRCTSSGARCKHRPAARTRQLSERESEILRLPRAAPAARAVSRDELLRARVGPRPAWARDSHGRHARRAAAREARGRGRRGDALRRDGTGPRATCWARAWRSSAR